MKKTVKVFTFIDRDTSPFLETWINYYSKLQNSSLAILHKNKLTPIIEANYPNVHFIDVSDYYNNISSTSYIPPNKIFTEYQAKFLLSYDRVIYTDLDEFIVHEDLNSVIQSDFDPCLVTTGVEIVQTIGKEDGFDFNKSIISQRSNMIYSIWYDKPLIVSNRVDWAAGKHNHGVFSTYVDGLYLVHLGKICNELSQLWAKENIQLYADKSIDWNAFLRTDPEEYKRALNNNLDPEYAMIQIPEKLKTLIRNIL
tara:strand:+ start:473 stop:1234 length:762 start_codon:yes stop_codon:yes gene_type:complete